MPITQAERLAAIAELQTRGEDVSGFDLTSTPGAGGLDADSKKRDQERVKLMQSTADEVKDLSGLVNDFAMRNRRTPTGGLLAIPGASAASQAPGLKGSDDLGVMDADALQAATRMRAPGMRLTQMEFQKFLGGVPSIKKAETSNRPFQTRLNNARAMAGAQSAFFDEYLRRRGSLQGADQAWSKWQLAHFGPEGEFMPDVSPEARKAAANQKLKAQSAKGAKPVLLGYEDER